eukprot:NODE_1030_length_1046_cov_220.734494_g986_i0.p1 GENE.NODE_1030_length_1046_cov_220.734494_g986_i0~~NODE_1030_length_1046_cov_220.734494_g986_i0.p1  ORF type:complete len:268 (+),score=7.05 NODE_1030_length_1046_cov_220.734494_g986_i0:104-907(+)
MCSMVSAFSESLGTVSGDQPEHVDPRDRVMSWAPVDYWPDPKRRCLQRPSTEVCDRPCYLNVRRPTPTVKPPLPVPGGPQWDEPPSKRARSEGYTTTTALQVGGLACCSLTRTPRLPSDRVSWLRNSDEPPRKRSRHVAWSRCTEPLTSRRSPQSTLLCDTPHTPVCTSRDDAMDVSLSPSVQHAGSRALVVHPTAAYPEPREWLDKLPSYLLTSTCVMPAPLPLESWKYALDTMPWQCYDEMSLSLSPTGTTPDDDAEEVTVNVDP